MQLPFYCAFAEISLINGVPSAIIHRQGSTTSNLSRSYFIIFVVLYLESGIIPGIIGKDCSASDEMMTDKTDYNLFFELIRKYSGSGFMKISDQDHFMIRLNKILKAHKQFFYISDLTTLRILYTSPQVLDILGIEPGLFDLSYNLKNTHPLDILRRSRSRVNVIEAGQELFIKKSGSVIISSDFRTKNTNGAYIHTLVQCYIFYNSSPNESVYLLQVNTQIDNFSKRFNKGQYHWYAGADLTYFRYPDKALLNTGSNLTEREMEVIKCIQKGMNSKDIGEKLFLSPLTVNTHRRNILKKTGKSSITEVIYELDHIGIF